MDSNFRLGHVRQAGGDLALELRRHKHSWRRWKHGLWPVRLRAAIDGMADCAATAAPLSSPAPDGAPLRGVGA
jgi:hypothetical protein